MKHFLMLLASLISFTLSAQNQIATLSHDGTITTKYGADAFKTLYKTAVDGDIITLSSGTFNSPSKIEDKYITIRGAGMNVGNPNDTYSEPTIITGETSVLIRKSASNLNLSFEGIIFKDRLNITAQAIQFNKCRLYNVGNSGDMNNSYFLHCYVDKMGVGSGVYAKIINSVIKSFNGGYTDSNSREFFFINSIIETSSEPYYSLGWGARMQNCVIVYTGTDNGYFENSGNTNNLLIGKNDGNPFPNCDEGHPNYVLPQNTNIFEDNSFYKLADDFKGYKGTDGTEVGIYGGPYPFSAAPSNPQIKKFQVAPKTTADGKLSVDIEISMPN